MTSVEESEEIKSPWDNFIRLVYQKTYFSYAEIEGEKYYSGTTKWWQGTDKSCDCDGYSDCTLKRLQTLSPIKYGLDFPPSDFKEAFDHFYYDLIITIGPCRIT